ncbi:MAG: iron-only hydrogenase system regulator [Lachnospiraceae bacterium]|jgi:putative iron-only hydrogenase system regulator|nr:iron-only hydrogenase system regulator [Lachnospiraceae bacterium]
MDTRVAVIAVIIENEDSVAHVNALLHEARAYIIGRMGIPYHARGINLISLAVDAPQPVIAELSGKLGQLPGVSAKAAYSKVLPETGC